MRLPTVGDLLDLAEGAAVGTEEGIREDLIVGFLEGVVVDLTEGTAVGNTVRDGLQVKVATKYI